MRKRAIKADDLLRLHFVSDPQLSPDGSQLLITKATIDKEKNKYVSHLFTVPVKGGAPKQWTQVEGGAAMGRWSPNGKSVAFVSGREKPSAQIYIVPMDGGEARKATALPEGSIGAFAWSPDVTKIAFTFREVDALRTTDAEKKRKESGGSPPPWELDELWYRCDGDGYFGAQRHAVYVLDVASGKHTKLYDKDKLGSYSFDWTRDSKALIVAHSASREPLLQKPNDRLYHVPLRGDAKMLPGLKKGTKGAVRVSPDGKTVAYLGDVSGDDPWGIRNVRLFVSPIKGGSQKCLTPKDDYCLEASTLSDTGAGGNGIAEWSADGKQILVTVATHGTAQVGSVDARKGGLRLLTGGEHVLGVGNTARGAVALTRGTPTEPAEAAVLKDGKVKVLTSFNAPVLKEIEISAPTETWVRSKDGTKVHTWCLKPAGSKAGKKYPAVIEVHGGPHAQYGWAFFHEFQLLAAQGYVVFYSNPRGSKGYGEKFCAAIRRDWGNKDWADVSAVKAHVFKQPFVDKKRVGIMGGSYGGFMTNWAIGHTQDFVAGITDRCVFNWLSMAGNSDFPLNRDGYFGGCAWGPISNIKELWRQSPSAYFDKVTTPCLIIHSEGDLRCRCSTS